MAMVYLSFGPYLSSTALAAFAKVPSKVRNFLWRLARQSLPFAIWRRASP
jgi:hypothetical protein